MGPASATPGFPNRSISPRIPHVRRLLSELAALPPEERGKVFEREVVPWLLRESEVYRRTLKQVWPWNRYPERHRWGPDAGIDLIAEERNGRLWAVQAKAYDADAEVTWRHISTFVGAAAARPEIGCLVLITTARGVGAAARRQLHACGKPVVIIDRHRLSDLDVSGDIGLADLRAAKPRPPQRTPRPHQVDAVRAAVIGFQDSDRGQIIHACGTGKTLTALWIKEALACQRTIVFAPSLALVDQTFRVWAEQAQAGFNAIAVCSDPTVGDADMDASTTAFDLAIPPTTDPARLRSALEAAPEPVVVFATYQSSAVVAAAMRGTELEFDLLIADEAHRTAGQHSGDFHRPLDQRQVPAARRLFMTATPRLFRQRAKQDADGDTLSVTSMDDVRSYGPRFHTFTFRAAIERDLLADYRVVVFGVTPGEVADLIAARAFVTPDGDDIVDAGELATHVGVLRAVREFGVRRALSFHRTVEGARVFARRLPQVANWLSGTSDGGVAIVADSVSGAEPIDRRRAVLARLRALTGTEAGVVANARCLAEGVDVPELDGIVFVDPKSSETDIVQAVGRAIRKSDTKAGISTVLLPVVVPNGDDAVSAVEASAHAIVWRVVDALRSHDEVLSEELDAVRRKPHSTSGQSTVPLPDKIVLRLPQDVSPRFGDALSLKLLERTTSAWEESYGVLVAFKARNGHCDVPHTHIEAGYRLGEWVNNQRQNHRLGKLAVERIARLESLGMTWGEARDERWEKGFAALEAFRCREGHSRVPPRYMKGKFRLGEWVNNQRLNRRKGKLAAERIAKLEALGFVWNTQADRWERGLAALQAFRARAGHCIVPEGHTEAGYRLGNWVRTQIHNRHDGKLGAERVAMLEALGMTWGETRDEQWERALAALQAFRARVGHFRVPPAHMEGKFRLGRWMSELLKTPKNRFAAERIARLEALDFVWNPRDDQWERHFAALRAYRARTGHCIVPKGHIEAGYRLERWVRAQIRNRSELAADQVARLDALGFSWNPQDDLWEWGFAALQAFHAREKHCRVPPRYVEGTYSLGLWVRRQQRGIRAGKLSTERIARLAALGFEWYPREAR